MSELQTDEQFAHINNAFRAEDDNGHNTDQQDLWAAHSEESIMGDLQSHIPYSLRYNLQTDHVMWMWGS
jgi:hypothetical protein